MKRKIVQWILYLLLVGMTAGVLVLAYDGNGLLFLCAVLFFLFSLWLIPALHETGHYVFGKAAGLTFYSLSVGPFVLSKGANGLSLHLKRGGAAGECVMFPVDGEGVEKKLLLFSVGGVLFNGIYLLLGLVAVLWAGKPVVWACVGMTLPYCVYQIALNLLPFDGFDGFLIRGLLRKDPSALTRASAFCIQGFLAQGRTPSQIEEKYFFSLPQLPEDDENFILMQYLKYLYFLDMGAASKAIKAICRLEDCLEYLPAFLERRVFCELSFVYSRLKENEYLAGLYRGKCFEFRNTRGREEGVSAAEKRASLAYAVAFRREEIYREWRDKTPEPEQLSGIGRMEERLLKEILKDIDNPDEE